MVNRLKSILICSLLFIFLNSGFLFAQKFEYGIKYEGIGDNREYFSRYSTPETIFGSRLACTVGFNTDSIHQFKTGISYFYEYGSKFLELPPHLLAYYSFNNEKLLFKMGAFPRSENLNFPAVFISSKYEYYHPTVDGLLIHYKTKNSSLGTVVDWVSRQDSDRREQFWVGFYGHQKLGRFIIDDYAYMFHNAHRMNRLPGENIEDNMGSLVLAGINLSAETFFDVLTLQSGMLSTAFRNRGDGSAFMFRHSSYSSLNVAYRSFGVELIMKLGSQHHLAFGDDFYNTAKNYSSLKLFADFISSDKVKGNFAWTFHLANGDLDQQQQIKLLYYFDGH